MEQVTGALSMAKTKEERLEPTLVCFLFSPVWRYNLLDPLACVPNLEDMAKQKTKQKQEGASCSQILVGLLRALLRRR